MLASKYAYCCRRNSECGDDGGEGVIGTGGI